MKVSWPKAQRTPIQAILHKERPERNRTEKKKVDALLDCKKVEEVVNRLKPSSLEARTECQRKCQKTNLK
jgi:hypothetical protein